VPLLLEVKQFRNLSKPYQRVSKAEPGEKIEVVATSGIKRDHTFNLIVHDGVRFLKLVLLMPNQVDLIKKLYSRNKLLLKSGYVDSSSDRSSSLLLVDSMDQIEVLYSDKKSEKLTEVQNAI